MVASSGRMRVARFLAQVIFTALCGLITLAAIPYGTVEAWWVAGWEIATFALALLWITEGLLSGRFFVREHYLLLPPLLLLTLFAFIQSVSWGSAEIAGIEIERSLSSDPFETKLAAFRLTALALTLALLLRYTSTKRRLRTLVLIVIATATLSALFGIVRKTMQHDELGFFLSYLRKDVGFGQFINRNHFAFLMEMALGLALGVIVGGGASRERYPLYFAVLVPMWAGLVLCNSRGALISFLAQLVFLILIFPRSSASDLRDAQDKADGLLTRLQKSSWSFVVRIALIVVLIVCMGTGFIWLGGDTVVDRLRSVPGEITPLEDSVGGNLSRMEIWQASWSLIKDNPFAGIGFGGYSMAISRTHNASGAGTPQQAHNDYIELVASGGLIGSALVIGFLIAFVKSALVQLGSKDRFRRSICLGALVGLFGVAAHSLFDFGLHITANALVTVALVVLATRSLSLDEQLEREANRDGNLRNTVTF